MTRPLRIVLIGPTSAAYETIAAEVEPDLERLARAGVELEYRCTGAGPASIRSEEDVAAAAPHVVRAVAAAARDGFDAAIIDCADDPGLDAARAAVSIAVVGPGEAVRAAVAGAPHPVALLTGDDMRSSTVPQLVERTRRAATVVLGATGWSDLVEVLAVDGKLVIDPLPTAVDACVDLLSGRRCGEG